MKRSQLNLIILRKSSYRAFKIALCSLIIGRLTVLGIPRCRLYAGLILWSCSTGIAGCSAFIAGKNTAGYIYPRSAHKIIPAVIFNHVPVNIGVVGLGL